MVDSSTTQPKVTLRIRANNQRTTFLAHNLAFLLTILPPTPLPGVSHVSRSKFNQKRIIHYP